MLHFCTFNPVRIFLCLFLLLGLGSINAAAQNHARYSDIKRTWKDEGLEHQALHEANKFAETMRCREQFIYAKIVSEEWEIVPAGAGLIAGRYIHMELYGETYDGKCGVAHCVFRQRRLGDNTFSPKLKIVELSEFYALECE